MVICILQVSVGTALQKDTDIPHLSPKLNWALSLKANRLTTVNSDKFFNAARNSPAGGWL